MWRRGDSYDGGDQGVVNAFLASAGERFAAEELSPSMNVLVNDNNLESGYLGCTAARIYHFVGANKPWTQLSGWGERNEPALREIWQRNLAER